MCFSDKIHYTGCDHVVRDRRIHRCAGQKFPSKYDCQIKETTIFRSAKCYHCFKREWEDGMHGASPPCYRPQIRLKVLGEQGNVKVKMCDSHEEMIFQMDDVETPKTANEIANEVRNKQ